jgi:sulfatase modifying factor 1
MSRGGDDVARCMNFLTPTWPRRLLAGLALAVAVAPLASFAQAPVIEWVTIGDAGNLADTRPGGARTGFGSVADVFDIMKFEFTNSQYVSFLNSVDASGTNPYSIYDSNMGSSARGGIVLTATATLGLKYSTKTNMGDKPVNFVNWFDAARVSNWLHNGATSIASTETGAYTLAGGTSGAAVALNSGAQYWVPTENQWYKASYYKGSGTNAGYWNYSTASDTLPTEVSATLTGSGSNAFGSPVTSGNFANWGGVADWNGFTDGNVTSVGTNGGASPYDTYDMTGNVYEWITASNNDKVIRGGDFNEPSNHMSAEFRVIWADGFGSGNVQDVGFRLAAVPEPSTLALAAVGLAAASWQAVRRRRAGRAGIHRDGG